MFLQLFVLVFAAAAVECPKDADKPLKKDSPINFRDAYCPTVDVTFASTPDTDTNLYDTIEANFFKGATIKSLTLTSKITMIDEYAFQDATILNEFNVAAAENLGAIGQFAFNGAIIPGFTFPKAISSVGTSAFDDCTIKGTLSLGATKQLTSITGERVFASANIGTLIITQYLSGVYTPSYPYEEYELEKCTFYDSTIGTLNLKDASSLANIPSYAFYKMTVTKAITLPDKLKAISDNSFKYASIAGSIQFPKDVKSISGNAFEGSTLGELDFSLDTELENIVSNAFLSATIDSIKSFPPNLKNINSNAFKESTINSALKFPAKLEKIMTSAFDSGKGFTELDFSQATSLTEIQSKAFYDTEVSKAINFPASLKKIGANAFEKSLLSTVTFNSNIEEIGGEAFQGIITLTSVNNLKVKDIKESAFNGCRNMVISKIEILPSGSIESNAFYNCYKLDSELIIPEATELDDDGELIYSKIEGSAFQNSGIKTITLNYYIDHIGVSAFENCTALKGSGSISTEEIRKQAFKDDIQFSLSKINATTIGPSAFENCRALGADIELYYFGTIDEKAFKNCKSLGELTLLFDEENGKDIKDKSDFSGDAGSINEEAFYRSGVTGALKIPITIKEIGKNAFAHCEKLTGLTIDECDDKELVLKIREKAFYHSKIGNKLELPYSTGYIGDYAFAYCPITSLDVHGSGLIFNVKISDEETKDIKEKSFLGKYAFYSCNIGTLNFVDGDVEFDKTTFRGCPITSLSLGNIKSIPTEAFYGMSTITSPITIPNEATVINDRAFAGCSRIPSVTFNEESELKGQNLKQGVFYGCSGLQRITLPFGITKIDDYAFYKCRELGSIKIGDLVASIGDFAFYDCSNLEGSLTFPIELKTIGDSSFQNCDKLTGSLEFPDTLTKIGKKAFMGCKSFDGHVSFGRSILLIDEYAFRDCGFKEKLIFPEYLYEPTPPPPGEDPKEFTISKGAFYGCSGFTGDLILPRKAKLLESAFHGCSGFNGQLDLNDMKTVPKSAFQGCSGFIGQIPTKDLETIGEHAFHGCSGFNGSLDLSSLSEDKDDEGNGQGYKISEYAFCNCRGLNGPLVLQSALKEVKDHAFEGCSGITGTLDCSEFTHIYKYAFSGCSGLTGKLDFEDSLTNIEQYAFQDCSGFSDRLTFRIGDSLDIDQCAFKGCSGFKNGKLSFMIKDNEESLEAGSGEGEGKVRRIAPFYRYDYFLKIGNDAFDGTKFKDIYYLGRFEPDCDYDIGISQIKGIHTSSNYANKTFCNYPLHKSKLSGGAIAGIVIACIVVVAAIVALIIYFVIRNRKNKDNSEGEVEMNQDP